MTRPGGNGAEAVVAQLRAEGDPAIRADLADRYGIHTDNAVGIRMRRMKAIAKPLAPDHELATDLWATGLYEARTVAAFVDDPALVDAEQMHRWSRDFDNWAIVDTVCFNLFDRSPDAWSMLQPWADSPEEFIKRAGFALLWALAHHDRDATDEAFHAALPLIEANAHDDRPLVTKAQTMALRAIATKRPNLTPAVVTLAQRLAQSSDAPSRRIGRPIIKAFAPTT